MLSDFKFISQLSPKYINSVRKANKPHKTHDLSATPDTDYHNLQINHKQRKEILWRSCSSQLLNAYTVQRQGISMNKITKGANEAQTESIQEDKTAIRNSKIFNRVWNSVFHKGFEM